MSTVGLVVDMQNDFCSEEGALAKDGFDIERVQKIVEPINRMTDRLRRLNCPVLFLQSIYTDSDGRFLMPGLSQQAQERWPWRGVKHPFLQEGTTGIEISKELTMAPTDVVVRKWTHDGFYLSQLEGHLRALGAETIVVMGATSDCCVLFTAQEAAQRGYRVVIPASCVNAYEEQAHMVACDVLNWVVGSVLDDAAASSFLDEMA